MRAALAAAAAVLVLASACSGEDPAATSPASTSTSPATSPAVSSASSGASSAAESASGSESARSETADSRCDPDRLDDPARRSPAVDPGTLYDGVLDYAPYRSLTAMMKDADVAMLGEVASWRVADPAQPRGAAVMTLTIVRQVKPAGGAGQTLDIRFWRSHQFGSSGQRSLMSLDDKRDALPPGACVIAVGSPGPSGVLTPRGLAPQGLMIEQADGSFTGARVPRQDFGGWVPRGTPRSEEFSALVRQLDGGGGEG